MSPAAALALDICDVLQRPETARLCNCQSAKSFVSDNSCILPGAKIIPSIIQSQSLSLRITFDQTAMKALMWCRVLWLHQQCCPMAGVMPSFCLHSSWLPWQSSLPCTWLLSLKTLAMVPHMRTRSGPCFSLSYHCELTLVRTQVLVV